VACVVSTEKTKLYQEDGSRNTCVVVKAKSDDPPKTKLIWSDELNIALKEDGEDPFHPPKKAYVPAKVPRFTQKANVCLVVLVGAPAKVLLKYALADERKRTELLMV
jgi:hypothetical protein